MAATAPSARATTPTARTAPTAPATRAPGEPEPIRAARASDGDLIALVPVVAMAVGVGLMFHRVFGFSSVLLPTLVAALVPAVTAGAMRVGLRAPVAAAVTVHVVTAVMAGCAAYARDHTWAGALPTPDALAALCAELIDAPREILTTVLPAGPSEDSIVLVPTCVLAASAAGAELALRTRLVALPALPATVLLVGAVLLATGAPGTSLPLVAGFAAAAGLLFALRDPVRRIAHSGLAALLALALAVPGALAASWLPGASRHAFDPRGHVDAPAPLTLRGPSPLAYISAWSQHPETPLFTASDPAPSPGGTLYRLAVLENYDGVSWSPVDRFVPTGGRVPDADPQGTPEGDEVAQDITIGELTGVFVPAIDRPERIDAGDARFAVDPAGGVLATATPLRPGMRYQVTSRPVGHDPRRTEYAAAGHTASALALPDRDASGASVPVVDELRRYAQDATAGAGFPYQQALRLAAWLRGHAVSDPQAIPGHSFRHVQYFLDTSRRGTSEQFATAFALMARSLALPTRVVVGFRAGAGSGAPAVTQVRGGDVLVWAEVEFEGVGWVPFFPTPGPGTATSAVAPPTEDVPEPVPAPAEPAPSSPAAAPGPPSRDDVDKAIEGEEHAPAEPTAQRATDHGISAGWLGLLGAGSLAVGSYLALAFAGPALVRRTRSRGSPARRVVGAWDQIADELCRTGPPLPPGATSGDVVGHADRYAGPDAAAAARAVADAADAVTFGGRTASEELAEACAGHERALRAQVKASLAADRRARLGEFLGRLRPRKVARTVAVVRVTARQP